MFRNSFVCVKSHSVYKAWKSVSEHSLSTRLCPTVAGCRPAGVSFSWDCFNVRDFCFYISLFIFFLCSLVSCFFVGGFLIMGGYDIGRLVCRC